MQQSPETAVAPVRGVFAVVDHNTTDLACAGPSRVELDDVRDLVRFFGVRVVGRCGIARDTAERRACIGARG